MLVGAGLLAGAIRSINSYGDGTSPWSFKMGQTTNAVLSSSLADSSVIGAVLVANLPQLIISSIYVLYNSILTSMLLGLEWSKFSSEGCHLRVSTPQGLQRSTTWLQLPYEYSVPLTGATFCLHWFTSQSVFLTLVNYYDTTYDSESNSVESEVGNLSACGYSPMGIIGAMVTAATMLLGICVLGFLRYSPGIPLCSCNSLAISAACHRPEGDTDAAVSGVKWGEVLELQTEINVMSNGLEESKDAGHCCITSRPVESPVRGKYYY